MDIVNTRIYDEYKTNLVIEGGITTNKSHDEWLSDFITWLESRGETFGGYTDIDKE